MTIQALSHLTVVDLTHHIAGPYCTKLLAGFGANVVKVERPVTGDPLRSRGPFFRDEEGPERSIPFLWLNTGKRSVTLNLKHSDGREILLDLVRRANIVVENFSPRVLPSLKLDFEALRKVNPSLVMTSISNFGQTGPNRNLKASEHVAQALSGVMSLTGDPDKAPLRAGPALAQYTAGAAAYIATLVGLYRRMASGEPQHQDVSIQEATLDNIEVALVEQLHLGRTARRSADKHALVPWGGFPARDGFAVIVGGPIRHWLKAADLFEEPRVFEPRFRHVAGRMAHREEFEALIAPWVARHRKEQIYHAGQARKLAFGHIASVEQAMASRQHAARSFFEDVEHPIVGTHAYCGGPFRADDCLWRQTAAPLVGEHNRHILCGMLGRSEEDLERLRREGVT
jgi:CoA:oxalate CoA-transferase